MVKTGILSHQPFVFLFLAAPVTHGNSQARDPAKLQLWLRQILNPRHHSGNSLGTLLLEQHQHDSQDTLWEAQGQWMPPRGGAQGTSGFASFLPGTSQEQK